jgi:hypothetical protein
MPLTDYALDQFVAPEMSRFTAADIPDVPSRHTESAHWLHNFVLNSLLRVSVSSPHREYIFNFLRRSVDCFVEYGLAREATYAYLAGASGRTAAYLRALHHWEAFLGTAWHAFNSVAKLVGMRAFEKRDGSLEERLNHLYNRIKHTESAIENGQMPRQGTLPVWLTNRGLTSIEHCLTWEETGVVLERLARCAERLQDPTLGLNA